MTIQPRGPRGDIEPNPGKLDLSHDGLDDALMSGIQGVDVLGIRQMNEGDVEMYLGGLAIARLNYAAEYQSWRAGRLDHEKIEDKRLPRVPSFEAVADNLQYGAVEKKDGVRVVKSLDLRANVRIAALMNAARLVEGRAVTQSGPVRLARRAGVMAIELAGGEASVTNSQVYLQGVVNEINEMWFDSGARRNIGPWASPFLWAVAIDRLKDLRTILPKDRHSELKYMTVPLAVGLEQSLALTKNWAGHEIADLARYPAKLTALQNAIHQARRDARFGRFSAEFLNDIRRYYRTGEAQAAAIERARRDAFMRKLLPVFMGDPRIPHPRTSPE